MVFFNRREKFFCIHVLHNADKVLGSAFFVKFKENGLYIKKY